MVGFPNKELSDVMLKSIGQAVRALGAELRRRLLDIDNYFLSLPVRVPIFSTVSWPPTVPNILQAKNSWFHCPQSKNSSAVMGKRQHTGYVE